MADVEDCVLRVLAKRSGRALFCGDFREGLAGGGIGVFEVSGVALQTLAFNLSPFGCKTSYDCSKQEMERQKLHSRHLDMLR